MENPNLEILMIAVDQLEDIIAVIDGRAEISGEVKRANAKLVSELAERFSKLLKKSQFIDAVSGHMPTDLTSQARVPMILETIKKIASL